MPYPVVSMKTSLLCALAAALAIGWGVEHVRHADSRAEVAWLNARISAIDAESSRVMALATKRVAELERALATARTEQEKKDADAKRTLEAERRKLRDLSRAAGGPGMRDPHAAAACRCGDAEGPGARSAGSSAGDGSQAGGLLSAPLEQLLLDITFEADAINVAYASCRADALELRRRLAGTL